MKIEQLKTTDAWKLIECVADGKDAPPKDLEERISEKYKGTGVECDPYNYEYENLAAEIVKCEDYPGFDDFMKDLPDVMADAFYKTGTDYDLMKAEKALRR